MHILFLLKSAFSLCMLYDAGQRKADRFWYFIILMPGGAILYFFIVKLRDPQLSAVIGKLLEKPKTLSQLRYDASDCPSASNRLVLAQGLFDAGEVIEAKEIFSELLKGEPDNLVALYGISHCYHNVGQYTEASRYLEKIVEQNFSYRDFDAALLLAQSLLAKPRTETTKLSRAKEIALDIAKKSKSLKNTLGIAQIQKMLAK